MNQYMIDIEIHEDRVENFFTMVPEQRDQINKLMTEGRISSVTLSFDRARLWITMFANNEAQVHSVMDTFVLIDAMNFNIRQVMFHVSNTQLFPQLYLN